MFREMTQRKKSLTMLIVLLLALFFIISLYAPQYLNYADKPVKSDAIVLFSGKEQGTRIKEAHHLIREGFADYLIIPATGQVNKLSSDGSFEHVNWKRTADVSNQSEKANQPNIRHRFFEDTHKEAIRARGMMERLGCTSAILVSSSYHMRRIKMIAGRVFGDTRSFYYVPTRYETRGEDFWFFNSRERNYILSECAKIAWFLVYSPFV
jgi:uncharacterized SAM-binding protein YcdF (DUF218 family)